MLIEVRGNIIGVATFAALGCGAPQGGPPAPQESTPASKAVAPEPREPATMTDLRTMCAAADGLRAIAPEQRASQWVMTVERQITTPRAIELVRTLALVAPDVRWTVLRNGAAELGVPDWCPQLAAVFAAPAVPVTAEPARLSLGARTFTASAALATRFDARRRVVISSQPTTCEELLAIPEKPRKGRVSAVLTLPWKTGRHPISRVEFIDDDTREVTVIEAPDGTAELTTSGEAIGDSAPLVVKFKGEGGALAGAVSVRICE